ncbi:MAG: family transporter [Candidatus Hydrogenedentes bacterium]|nr:family transporter [Candidatus Hydrogenedentota bacterium]
MSLFALAVSAVGWAAAPVFIRGLADAYDPYTQALTRYAAAAVPLLLLSLVFYRADLWKVFGMASGMLGVSLVNAAQQCAWTVACYRTTATLAQLVAKLSIVFVILFSYFLFREERAVIKSRSYLVGTVASFAGCVLVLCKDPATLMPQFDLATVLLLLVAVLWAVYVVWSRHLVTDVHPVPMFTVLALYTTAMFGVLALLFGDPMTIARAGWRANTLTAASGVICIALSHSFFLYAQKRLGSALCSSIILLNPLITYAMALVFWSDERMVATQWVGTVILILGTFLVTWAGQRAQAGKTAIAAGQAGE